MNADPWGLFRYIDGALHGRKPGPLVPERFDAILAERNNGRRKGWITGVGPKYVRFSYRSAAGREHASTTTAERLTPKSLNDNNRVTWEES